MFGYTSRMNGRDPDASPPIPGFVLTHPRPVVAGDRRPAFPSGPRQHYDAVFREWEQAAASFADAVDAFMNDGARVDGGLWLLSMSQLKAGTLDSARTRLRIATNDLDAAIDDIRSP